MNFAARESRPPRSRGRGAFRGSRRGTRGHFSAPRGRGRGFTASRSPTRTFSAVQATKSAYNHLPPSISTRRFDDTTSDKYSSSYRPSGREEYRPKYPRTTSPDYYQESSSYRSTEIPKKKYSHSDYQSYDDEGGSSSRYLQEERSERREYRDTSDRRDYRDTSDRREFRSTDERRDFRDPTERREYRESTERHHSPPAREPMAFRLDEPTNYHLEEPPPPPLLSEEYMIKPETFSKPRGRGLGRGRGALSRGVIRGGVNKKRGTRTAHGTIIMGRDKSTKYTVMRVGTRPRLYKMSPSPDRGEFEETQASPTGDEDHDDDQQRSHHSKASPPKKTKFERRTRTGHRFIPLNCPHCKETCTTFRQYEMHLLKKRHILSMTKVALRTKQQVLKMRAIQRSQQNEQETNSENKELTSFTKFCAICKLNYRQSKSEHTNSKSHEDMRNFLLPTCKICNINFQSTRLYDQHLCSIEHLKTAFYQKNADKRDDSEGEIDAEALNCLEGFMVVDSVGDDEEEVEPEPLLGEDKIKMVEAQFCELCQRFLPRLDDVLKARAVHCRAAFHQRNYNLHQKAVHKQKMLEKKAARREQKSVEENDAPEEPLNDVDDRSHAGESKESEAGSSAKGGSDEAEDEALWRDVNNDIGELLKERGDDEEDEENSMN